MNFKDPANEGMVLRIASMRELFETPILANGEENPFFVVRQELIRETARLGKELKYRKDVYESDKTNLLFRRGVAFSKLQFRELVHEKIYELRDYVFQHWKGQALEELGIAIPLKDVIDGLFRVLHNYERQYELPLSTVTDYKRFVNNVPSKSSIRPMSPNTPQDDEPLSAMSAQFQQVADPVQEKAEKTPASTTPAKEVSSAGPIPEAVDATVSDQTMKIYTLKELAGQTGDSKALSEEHVATPEEVPPVASPAPILHEMPVSLSTQASAAEADPESEFQEIPTEVTGYPNVFQEAYNEFRSEASQITEPTGSEGELDEFQQAGTTEVSAAPAMSGQDDSAEALGEFQDNPTRPNIVPPSRRVDDQEEIAAPEDSSRQFSTERTEVSGPLDLPEVPTLIRRRAPQQPPLSPLVSEALERIRPHVDSPIEETPVVPPVVPPMDYQDPAGVPARTGRTLRLIQNVDPATGERVYQEAQGLQGLDPYEGFDHVETRQGPPLPENPVAPIEQLVGDITTASRDQVGEVQPEVLNEFATPGGTIPGLGGELAPLPPAQTAVEATGTPEVAPERQPEAFDQVREDLILEMSHVQELLDKKAREAEAEAARQKLLLEMFSEPEQQASEAPKKKGFWGRMKDKAAALVDKATSKADKAIKTEYILTTAPELPRPASFRDRLKSSAKGIALGLGLAIGGGAIAYLATRSEDETTQPDKDKVTGQKDQKTTPTKSDVARERAMSMLLSGKSAPTSAPSMQESQVAEKAATQEVAPETATTIKLKPGQNAYRAMMDSAKERASKAQKQEIDYLRKRVNLAWGVFFNEHFGTEEATRRTLKAHPSWKKYQARAEWAKAQGLFNETHTAKKWPESYQLALRMIADDQVFGVKHRAGEVVQVTKPTGQTHVVQKVTTDVVDHGQTAKASITDTLKDQKTGLEGKSGSIMDPQKATEKMAQNGAAADQDYYEDITIEASTDKDFYADIKVEPATDNNYYEELSITSETADFEKSGTVKLTLASGLTRVQKDRAVVSSLSQKLAELFPQAKAELERLVQSYGNIGIKSVKEQGQDTLVQFTPGLLRQINALITKANKPAPEPRLTAVKGEINTAQTLRPQAVKGEINNSQAFTAAAEIEVNQDTGLTTLTGTLHLETDPTLSPNKRNQLMLENLGKKLAGLFPQAQEKLQTMVKTNGNLGLKSVKEKGAITEVQLTPGFVRRLNEVISSTYKPNHEPRLAAVKGEIIVPGVLKPQTKSSTMGGVSTISQSTLDEVDKLLDDLLAA